MMPQCHEAPKIRTIGMGPKGTVCILCTPDAMLFQDLRDLSLAFLFELMENWQSVSQTAP